MILLYIAAALGFLVFLISILLCRYCLYGKRQDETEARSWQEKHYSLEWYDRSEKEPFIVTSGDGYTLYAEWVRCPGKARGCVILSHGYTDNHLGALKYGEMYQKLGFDLVVYDLRGHGRNKRTFCTYSIRESEDLAAVIKQVRKRSKPGLPVGLHGESLGAATTIACLKTEPDVDFAVADCAFAEIMPIFKRGLKGMRLPTFLVYTASLCSKLFYGYAFSKMRPVDALPPGRGLPILFIHGADDDFIPPQHSVRMHDAAPGSDLVLIPDAGHASSVFAHPDLYARAVADFLGRHFQAFQN